MDDSRVHMNMVANNDTLSRHFREHMPEFYYHGNSREFVEILCGFNMYQNRLR